MGMVDLPVGWVLVVKNHTFGWLPLAGFWSWSSRLPAVSLALAPTTALYLASGCRLALG